MVREPGGGAGATTSLARSPASAKRSPSRITVPATLLVGRSAGAASAPPQARQTDASTSKERSEWIIALCLMPPALLDLVERGQHLVGSLDHLRVHLIGALRRDEVGDLRHDVDVGGLEQALVDRAESGRAGRAGDRRARGRRLLEEAAAERL